jgi:hypothetical protein
MNRRDFLASTGAAVLAHSLPLPAQTTPVPPLPPPGADGWISLINGRDLTGWYTMLQTSGKGVAEKRNMISYQDGMLHILGNDLAEDVIEPGYIASNQEFENVHLRVEFKFGERRFTPRRLSKRDNGLLFGLVGPDKVWPRCVECQIEEGDIGDMILVDGVRGIQLNTVAGIYGVGISPESGWPSPNSPLSKGGTNRPPKDAEPTTGRKIKDGNFEKLGDWTVVEVIWQGDKAALVVNGRCVNMASSLQQPDPANPGSYIPLTRGKIALEIEYAETWYRRVEVKALAA